MDYQTQQMKIFPILASAYVHGAGTDYMTILYDKFIKNLEKDDFSLLDVMNHFTSGMKSNYTQSCVDGIYNIRQALGEAGFTAWSNIPTIFDELNSTVTFEGDNTVMA